jgi:hypothetical protein
MGIPFDHPSIAQALEKGLIRAEDLATPPTPVVPDRQDTEEPTSDRKRPPLVEPSFTAPGTWVLPIETASEANGREWRKRSNRTQAARKVVSEAFGRSLVWVAAFADHFHRGGGLRVVFIRLGGRQLDRSNLPVALKATEDAVALMLGADDGDPRWRAEWHQEPGGAVGVRIELSCCPASVTSDAAGTLTGNTHEPH